MKYLQSIYESQDSEYKQKYFEIIKYYQEHPVEKHSADECKENWKLYTEYHHINPRWYYKLNKLELDNSTNNLILVPFDAHIKLHIYLAQHFKAINDFRNMVRADRACVAICMDTDKRNVSCNLTDEQIKAIAEIRIDDAKRQSELATRNNLRDSNPWRHVKKENIPLMYEHYIKYGFEGIEKFGYKLDEDRLIGYLRNYGYDVLKFGEKFGRAYKEEELLKMRDDYDKYGFEYVKNNDFYRGNEDSFIGLLDIHHIPNSKSNARKKYNIKKIKKGVPQKKRISDELLKEMYDYYVKYGYEELKKKYKCPKYEHNFKHIFVRRRCLKV